MREVCNLNAAQNFYYTCVLFEMYLRFRPGEVMIGSREFKSSLMDV
jgi:hypothetical protein